MNEQLMTVEDAAEWLKARGMDVSHNAIRSWCKSGVVAAVRPGRTFYIPVAELERITTPQTKK